MVSAPRSPRAASTANAFFCAAPSSARTVLQIEGQLLGELQQQQPVRHEQQRQRQYIGAPINGHGNAVRPHGQGGVGAIVAGPGRLRRSAVATAVQEHEAGEVARARRVLAAPVLGRQRSRALVRRRRHGPARGGEAAPRALASARVVYGERRGREHELAEHGGGEAPGHDHGEAEG